MNAYNNIELGAGNLSFTMIGGRVGGPTEAFPAREGFNLALASNYAGLLIVSGTNLSGGLSGAFAQGINVKSGLRKSDQWFARI